MGDKPIIFSGPMIRALLDGRKTMTRRRAKWTPTIRADGTVVSNENYAPGDRLWCRESFCIHEGGTIRDPGSGFVIDHTDTDIEYKADREKPGGRWRPSIHMPRWASRLTLTVTAVKVERLQDISTLDARAEGIPEYGGEARRLGFKVEDENHFWDNRTTVENFRGLWTSIHGPGAWEANPWVAAITFTVERRNIDAPTAPASEG